MGGNAVKNCYRRTKPEYLVLEAEIIQILSKYFIGYRIPKFCSDKESFGDIDILYIPNDLFDIQRISEELQSKEVVKNGPVTSIEYNNFQIDLIRTTPNEIELSCDYLSWSNFGKLIGIICSQVNLIFGHNGLFLNVELDKQYYKILLSKDSSTIFKFLGLDYNRFKIGFQTEIEMFQYVKTCNLYCDSIFLESQNNDFPKKRTDTFSRFSNTIDTLLIPFDNRSSEKVLHNALSFFDKTEEYVTIVTTHEKSRIIKQKFNGKIVTELTGLTDVSLGNFMKTLRLIPDFIQFVYETDNETVRKRIIHEFTKSQIK